MLFRSYRHINERERSATLHSIFTSKHQDKIELGNCDGIIINHLQPGTDKFDHGYGNNQTMIKLAYAYLKATGIQ